MNDVRSLLNHRPRTGTWVALIVMALTVAPAAAQPPGQVPAPGFVRLNLQGETQLQTLIDYVSQRLDIKFLYRSEVGRYSINVRAPSEIPVSSLLPLLNSVLRMEGLAIVDAEVPGWKRIVEANEMPVVARPGPAAQVAAEKGSATPVTQVFVLKHLNAQQLSQVVRPFLSQGANILALSESNILVVTDYATTVATVDRLIELVDRPRGDAVFEYYDVQHVGAESLAERMKIMLAVPQPAAAQSAPLGPTVDLFAEPRTNQIVVVGSPEIVQHALDLLRRFDVSLGLVTRVYRFQHVRAERFDKIIKGFLSTQDTDRLYTSSVDKEGNLLVVQATDEIHRRTEELQTQIDIPVSTSESPIRFYKLKNANALDVLYTLMALQEASGTSLYGGETPALDGGMAAPNQLPSPAPGTPFMPQGDYPSMGQGLNTLPGTREAPAFRMPLEPQADPLNPYDELQQTRSQRMDQFGSQLAGGMVTQLPGGARVSADISTNSLVIVAPPEVHEMYRSLIESLDRRRPQVLIEAKIVAVDTTDDFTLGVEVAAGDRFGLKRAFGFTSYGLSEIDPITGALRIVPSIGFNGTLVDPEVADVVVQALIGHTRARVMAAPRILVNDNATGQLESVTSIPFESVNASNTVSTTSLGGNQQAGTIITVTPHINEQSHLLLEFSVEFSTFTQSRGGNAALPPPRQIDRVGSTVTVPDGQTIIVGGLKRVGESRTLTGLPGISNIPILREVTSLTTKDHQTTSFFLFIRPMILTHEKFADLKYVSQKTASHAEIGGEHPVSRPVMIEQ